MTILVFYNCFSHLVQNTREICNQNHTKPIETWLQVVFDREEVFIFLMLLARILRQTVIVFCWIKKAHTILVLALVTVAFYLEKSSDIRAANIFK